MKCMGVLTEERMAQEAQRYGDAGDRPQVIWPNGVLASTAVGMFVSLLPPWDSEQELVSFAEYDGNRHETRGSRVLNIIKSKPCRHYLVPESLAASFWRF